MTTDLIITNRQEATMSSREIAELCEKRHDNVMRDIRDMLTQLHGEGGLLKFEDTYRNEQNGQSYPIFLLPKRETLILVSGYSVELRARIIDRWQELEAARSAPPIAPALPALPDFTNPAVAARAWAEQFEGREIAETKATALESRVSELAPKADALDLIASANGSMCITDAAKALQLRPKSLFTFLRQRDWIYRRDGAELGYQDKVAAGYLEHKTTIIDRDGVKETRIQVRVTPKGLTALARKFPFAALPSA